MSEEEKDKNQIKTNNNNIINDNIENIDKLDDKSKSSSRHNSQSNSKKSSKKSYSNHSSSYSSRSKSNSKNSLSRSRSNSYSSSSYSRSYSHEKRKKSENSKIFVTKLSYRITKRDLEREFGRFGQIRNLQLKKGYAFIDYYNKDDAKDAIKELNNQKLFGQQQRIVIEEAKGEKREREKRRERGRRDYRRSLSRSRDRYKDRDYYRRRTGPKKTDICFNCGKEGHWANECYFPRKER